MILVGATLLVAEVASLAGTFPDHPWWAQALGVAGVVTLGATALSAWRLASRPRRLFLGRDTSARPVLEVRKSLRRALLRGNAIDTASGREVAMLAAAETRTPIALLPLGVIAGNGGLTAYSAAGGASRWLALIVLVLSVPVVVLALVQSRRIQRAAAALGATPTVKNKPGR